MRKNIKLLFCAVIILFACSLFMACNEKDDRTWWHDDKMHWKVGFPGLPGKKEMHEFNEIITKEATCTADGKKVLTCECGYKKTEIIPAGHSYIEYYEVRATYHKFVRECKNCKEVEDEWSQLHHQDIGTFTFSEKAKNDYTDTTGKWTYRCTICDGILKETDGEMAREGNSLYAYKELANGQFSDGKEFNINGKTFYDNGGKNILIPMAQKFYRDLFIECESVLHNTNENYKDVFCRISTDDAKRKIIKDAGQDLYIVRWFFFAIYKWFVACSPTYFFLNPNMIYDEETLYAEDFPLHISKEKWEKLNKNLIGIQMFEEFTKAEYRQKCQNAILNLQKRYQGKFSDIESYLYKENEQSRVKAIYDEVCDLITYKSANWYDTYTLVGATNREGACWCYALTFSFICNLNGIEAYMIFAENQYLTTGKLNFAQLLVDGFDFESHAWSMAKIDDKWYYFDTTCGKEPKKTGITLSDHRAKYFGMVEYLTQINYWLPLPNADDMGTQQLAYDVA